MPRIADFGISRSLRNTFLTTAGGQAAGTPAFMAPELFSNGRASEKVDVFSFAVLLNETLTRVPPWDNCSPVQIIFAVGVQRERPSIAADCPEPLRALIDACWAHSPAKRPPFSEVLETLQALGLDAGE